MIDHIGINCGDYARSQEFYDTVLGVLGFSRQMDFGRAIGYGRDGKPSFWIADAAAGLGPGPTGKSTSPSRRPTTKLIEFQARPGRRVAARTAALAGISPGYFGAFVRDPDGNNVEAVCHES